MKQSRITGRHIYEEIKTVERELKEIREGMDAVAEQFDTYDCIPYQLLKEQYEAKSREYIALLKQEYTEAPQKEQAFPDF